MNAIYIHSARIIVAVASIAVVSASCAGPATVEAIPAAIETPLGTDSVETALQVLKQPTRAYVYTVRGKLRYIHEHDPNFVSKVTAALDDPDFRKKAKLIAILGSVGPAAAPSVPRILRADAEMRAAMLEAGFQPENLAKGISGVTADALASIGGAETQALLEKMLRDGSPDEAAGAADALSRMGRAARSLAPALLDRGSKSQTVLESIQFARIAVGIDPDAIAGSKNAEFWRRRIVEATADPNRTLAIQAAELLPLARVSPKEAMPIVVRLASLRASDEGEWLALSLAQTTMRYGNQGTTYIVQSAADSDEHIRSASLMLLAVPGLADSRQVTDVATRALSDVSANVRTAAIAALVQEGQDARSAIPALEKLNSDDDPMVRSAAAAAIEHITNPKKDGSR